ncbi:MAG: SynChlorMet cassette radical SAM/SPASM protein ScmE [Pseudomonadota bacterium]
MPLMKTPRSVDLAVTGRCNLRCRYCSHFSSAGDVERDLPAEVWLEFFTELNRCAVMEVCLLGGEPFIREDFKELINGIVRNRMRFSILSNGTLITDETASFLASTGRCDHVQVSIDGSGPGPHDACRGAGNYLRAVNGLRLLQKHGVPAAVRVTIHRGNVQDIENISALLIDDLGLPGFSTNSASYLGMCRKNAELVQLTAQERSSAMRTLLKLARRYEGRIGAAAGPLAEARAWREMHNAWIRKRSDLPGGGFLTGCGGANSTLGIRADGVMVPCIQMPDMALGRINEDDLTVVWQSHPELERFRKRREIPLSSFDFCYDCRYMPYCSGNCPAVSYAMLHDPYHPSPDACLKRFLESGGEVPLDQGI